MSANIVIEGTVSSKGQVTLPESLRATLGITTGSRIQFELRGGELLVRPELPISAFRGMLKPYMHLQRAFGAGGRVRQSAQSLEPKSTG